MKYYIYISDAKVDMLFPQVPHDIKKKVATEWKMDLKLLSAARKVETESEDNRIARLETVVDFKTMVDGPVEGRSSGDGRKSKYRAVAALRFGMVKGGICLSEYRFQRKIRLRRAICHCTDAD